MTEFQNSFKKGLKDGLPIALGYLSVSFTFGMMAVEGGLPVFTAVLISMTNLTSAGQFAGLDLILAGGAYLEMALTQLVINHTLCADVGFSVAKASQERKFA